MREIIEKLEHGIMVCYATKTAIVHMELVDADKILTLLKEQEQTIEALKEKLRLLEYGNHDCVQDILIPAT